MNRESLGDITTALLALATASLLAAAYALSVERGTDCVPEVVSRQEMDTCARRLGRVVVGDRRVGSNYAICACYADITR